MPTTQETDLAQIIVGAVPSVEMVRFVNSGTEATMSAIRLARAATGRDLVVKCIGCYHGHVDGLLVEAGSGALTLGVPATPGIPQSVAASTVTVHYNDLNAAREVLEKYPGQIAAFMVEPVAGSGTVLGGQPLLDPGEGVVAAPFDQLGDGLVQDLGIAQVREQRGGIADGGVLAGELGEDGADETQQATQLLAAAAGFVDDRTTVAVGIVEIGKGFVQLVERNGTEGRFRRLAPWIELVHPALNS